MDTMATDKADKGKAPNMQPGSEESEGRGFGSSSAGSSAESQPVRALIDYWSVVRGILHL